ncbi:MAG TPA: BamA/TamA family outer membrane protein [Candidatus Eisenbacteria bacterium]
MPRPRSAARLTALSIACAGALSLAGTACGATLGSDSTLARPVPPPPVRRAAEWETLETGLPEEARFHPIIGARYNRVDGPAPTLGAAFQPARAPAPVLFAEGTYAFSRKRPLYEAGFEAPLGDRPWLQIGGSVYRRTSTEDDWIVTEGENTIFALVARTDYRDHYESQGGQGYIGWSPGSDFSIRGGARFESQASLSVKTRVSLTGRHPEFRPNPPIEDGDEQAFTVHCRIGPAQLPARGGTHGEAVYERSGPPLNGDFEYGRLRGAIRNRIRLSPTRDLRARLIVGSTLTGSLPAQKTWYVGGIGTLRGHDFKTFTGDQFFVANAEFYQRARKNIYAFTFLDTGAAWFGSDNLGRQRPAVDLGLGVRIAEGPAAITVAKNLRDEKSKLRVGVRLGDRF